jgi:hypothetical protein
MLTHVASTETRKQVYMAIEKAFSNYDGSFTFSQGSVQSDKSDNLE